MVRAQARNYRAGGGAGGGGGLPCPFSRKCPDCGHLWVK